MRIQIKVMTVSLRFIEFFLTKQNCQTNFTSFFANTSWTIQRSGNPWFCIFLWIWIHKKHFNKHTFIPSTLSQTAMKICINFWGWVVFKVSQRLGLWFHLAYSRFFCSPEYVFRKIKALVNNLSLPEVIGNFLTDFCVS